MVAALADYDFRVVFRVLRGHAGWSQQTLGAVVGLDQARISAIERGVCRLRDVALLIAQLATRLWIPRALLGFGTTVGDEGGCAEGGELGGRRDFVQHIAALAVGTTGMAGVDVNRLTALLPHSDPTGTRHVGVTDVEALEQSTSAFRRQDFTQGSGLAREVAVTQLRAALPLLDARVVPELRPRLLLATADLATQAGWMSFNAEHHDAARRLWTIAADLARESDHPQGSDLTVYLLADIALQVVHLRRPEEALRLVHLGHTAAVSPHPVSASTASLLANIEARTHATHGDQAGCDHALGQALDHLSAIDSATAPPWTAYLGHTGVPGHQGSARYALAHAIAGDTDTAVAIGHHAVEAVTALHSPRAYDRLRVLSTALELLHNSAGVAELRDRLTATAA